MPRRRSSVLDALELFRAAEPAISMLNVIAFLYVCENEGLNVSELASVCRTTVATASRVARTLADAREGYPALIEARPSPDNPISRLLYLTPAGREVRAAIDGLIVEANPILPTPALQRLSA